VIVVNNAASGYVKALQHAMMGGRYQSADLVEMNYAALLWQIFERQGFPNQFFCDS